MNAWIVSRNYWGGRALKILNITLLCIAVIYTLMLTLFGGDVINYLQNIVMYLFPITNKIVFDDKTGR